MIIVLIVLGAIIVTSGIWFAILRRSVAEATTQPSLESGEDRRRQYEERLQGSAQWFSLFMALQPAFTQSTSIPAMADGIKHAFRNINPKLGILLAVGPMQDVAALVRSAGNRPAIALNPGSFITCLPEIEADLCTDLAHVLYHALLAKEPTRPWWLLHELAPEIQSRLLKHYHLAGQAIVIPLTAHDVPYGVALLTGFSVEGSAAALRETGERAALLGSLITCWMHGMLPQILGERPKGGDESFLTDALASMVSMEQSVLSLQEQAASADMLEALADYSQRSTAQIAETSKLAIQTCASLRRICQAELAMVLLPRKGAGSQWRRWKWKIGRGRILPRCKSTRRCIPDCAMSKSSRPGPMGLRAKPIPTENSTMPSPARRSSNSPIACRRSTWNRS